MNGVSFSVIHDKRIKRKDGTFAVKLRVTHFREQKYFPLGIHLSPEDWEKVNQNNPRKQFKEYKLLFARIEQKAATIINNMDDFSFDAFINAYDSKTPSRKEVFYLFQAYIDKLKTETDTVPQQAIIVHYHQ
jgi:hypothetical protein